MRMQPMVIGHHYMASAGQYLATEAAHAILCAGGNAIDAGVAGGIALRRAQRPGPVLRVAPMLIHLADRNETVSIAGLGCGRRRSTSRRSSATTTARSPWASSAR